ncbi:MAG: hypothetical protein ACLRSW_01375 [Christensenellaceae bacterium]
MTIPRSLCMDAEGLGYEVNNNNPETATDFDTATGCTESLTAEDVQRHRRETVRRHNYVRRPTAINFAAVLDARNPYPRDVGRSVDGGG